MKAPFFASSLFAFFVLLACYIVAGQPFDYPTANLSTTWTNSESAPHSVTFTDGSTVRAILLRGSFGPRYACGFYCNGTYTSYLFGVFIVQTNSGSGIVQPAIGFPQVVWSANRNHPVKLGATLSLTGSGDLVLREADGSSVWSTNTAGKSVAGMNVTDSGNLVLFDSKNTVVWQSFDYPTDSLVPGQKLFEGKKLTASVSSTNWSTGSYSLQVNNRGLFAANGCGVIHSWTPVSLNPGFVTVYLINGIDRSSERSYVRFLNGSLSLFVHSTKPSNPDAVIPVPQASSAQYMKMMPDGHLKVWEWQSGWTVVADFFGVSGRMAYEK